MVTLGGWVAHELPINNAAGAGQKTHSLPTHLNITDAADYDVMVLERTPAEAGIAVDVGTKTAADFAMTWVGNGDVKALLLVKKPNNVKSPVG